MTMQLDDWQQEVLDYRGDLILCTGRQIGKTTIMARKAAERMLEKKTEIIIVSLTEDQAKLIINMILSYIENTARKKIAEKEKKPTQNKVTLKNGSYALARPVGNTGDALRGFTGDILIIDEASRMPELAFISAEPTLLSTGGEIWMCSTPHGKQGYFWSQYNAAVGAEDSEMENEMGWKVRHVNAEEALNKRPVNEFWTQEKKDKSLRRLKRLKERWSELRYGQEILAEFMDDLMRWYSEETIQKACILKRPLEIPRDGIMFMGNDLARMGGDKFTAEIFHRLGNNVRQVENFTEKKLLTTTNEQLIIDFTRKWNVRKFGIDAGAGTLGVSILDHLLNIPDMKRKAIAMNNRKIIVDADGREQGLFNEDMHDNMRAAMDSGELLLLDDEDIKASLRSVQVELREDQHGKTLVKIWGNDTHIVEGMMRGVWLAKKEKINNFHIYSM